MFKKFSLQDYFEARMLVSSRSFYFQQEGEKTLGLVPYADMLNHSNDSKPTHFFLDEVSNGFRVETLKEIPQNTEITTSYGQKCNSTFFMNYGFVNQHNQGFN